jgi:hypothetical protein
MCKYFHFCTHIIHARIRTWLKTRQEYNKICLRRAARNTQHHYASRGLHVCGVITRVRNIRACDGYSRYVTKAEDGRYDGGCGKWGIRWSRTGSRCRLPCYTLLPPTPLRGCIAYVYIDKYNARVYYNIIYAEHKYA